MRQNLFLSIVVLLLASLFLSSCNPARRLEKGKLRKKSAPFLVKKLEQNRINADWFSGKSKVAFRGKGQNIKANANILMRRDSVVWINVKKLGFEAVRVQITPDSVYFLNRLTRQYAVWDLGYLERQFNLPLDFNDLQELILGNAVMIESDGLEAKTKGPQYKLSGSQAGANTTYYLAGLTYLLNQIIVDDPAEQWKVQIDQEEYGLEKEYAKFSYFRNFVIDSQETGPISLNIKFSKIELNVPKKIKFEIPSRYSRIE